MSDEDWRAANQRVLVAEFARLKAQLAGDEIGAIERDLRSARKTLTSLQRLTCSSTHSDSATSSATCCS